MRIALLCFWFLKVFVVFLSSLVFVCSAKPRFFTSAVASFNFGLLCCTDLLVLHRQGLLQSSQSFVLFDEAYGLVLQSLAVAEYRH